VFCLIKRLNYCSDLVKTISFSLSRRDHIKHDDTKVAISAETGKIFKVRNIEGCAEVALKDPFEIKTVIHQLTKL
jgi:hypothetical protein